MTHSSRESASLFKSAQRSCWNFAIELKAEGWVREGESSLEAIGGPPLCFEAPAHGERLLASKRRGVFHWGRPVTSLHVSLFPFERQGGEVFLGAFWSLFGQLLVDITLSRSSCCPPVHSLTTSFSPIWQVKHVRPTCPGKQT